MKVFKINLDVDRFRSLLAADDGVHRNRLLAFDGSSKSEQWTKPLEAVFDNLESPIPDVMSCGAGNMLLWGRSLELLGPTIAPVAELLPVVWEGGNGKAVNFVGLSRCLDLQETQWYRHEGSGKRLFIERYAFVDKLVPRLIPFKVEEERFAQFCADHEDGSESLLSLVTANQLTGLKFDLVWSSQSSDS